MKLTHAAVFLLISTANFAQAESKIEELCKSNQARELRLQRDVQPNPDGYYLPGLKVQLSLNDPRLIQAIGEKFYLCTRSAATPDMSANAIYRLREKRAVKFLFVPAVAAATK